MKSNSNLFFFFYQTLSLIAVYIVKVLVFFEMLNKPIVNIYYMINMQVSKGRWLLSLLSYIRRKTSFADQF